MRISDWSSDVCSSDLALAFVQEAAEGALMLGVLVDIRDAQLGFPQERVVGALEYLPLLGHGGHHRFQRRAAIGVAEGAGINLLQIGRASCRARVCQYV